MDPLVLALLLLAGGAVLLIAELLLPTHGLLGVLGLVAIFASAVSLMWVNQWLGIAVLALLVLSSPFWIMAALRIWPHTPVGKRMVLTATTVTPTTDGAHLTVGQTGTAMTEMRPMGECEFGPARTQAVSQLGIIPAGATVRIVSLDGEKPVVLKA